MSFQVFDEKQAINPSINIIPGNGTNLLALYGIDALTRRIDAITMTSTDTVDRAVQVWVQINGLDIPLIEVPVPALAGHGAVKPVEALALLDLANLPALIVSGGNNIRVSAVAAVSTSKAITIIGWGGVC